MTLERLFEHVLDHPIDFANILRNNEFILERYFFFINEVLEELKEELPTKQYEEIEEEVNKVIEEHFKEE